MLARVYQPRGAGPFPVLLDVHGGVWTGGTRTSDEDLDRALAASGVVVAAIDVRQPPEAGYPASIADVHLAVRWLKAHAAELGGRPGAVGALGISSGGHQVLLVALRPRDQRYAALPLPGTAQPDGVLAYAVLCWPIVDPLARYRWAKARDNRNLVERHDSYWGTEDAMAEGNPQRILEQRDPPPLPPLLVLQGTQDENIPYTIVERFTKTYREAGGSVRLELFDGEPHGFVKLEDETPAAARALALMIGFVHEQATGRNAQAST